MRQPPPTRIGGRPAFRPPEGSKPGPAPAAVVSRAPEATPRAAVSPALAARAPELTPSPALSPAPRAAAAAALSCRRAPFQVHRRLAIVANTSRWKRVFCRPG
jgi:hypothetical protein